MALSVEQLVSALDGVAFRDEARQELTANIEALKVRLARAQAATVACTEQLAEDTTKLDTMGDGSDIRGKAEEMAGKLAELGLGVEVINSALKAQFGRVRVVDPNKPAKPPKSDGPKHLTCTLSDDVQVAILSAIAASGKAGITIESLNKQFAQGLKGDSEPARQVFAVVKNARMDGLVDLVPGTMARGARYYAIEA